MKIETEMHGDDLVIRIGEERIDAAVAIQFKDSMREATAQGHARVIVDLGAVQFLDSSGLGAVVAAMKQMGAGRKLELAGLSPTVDKVFRLTRMDSVFVIHPSVEHATGGVARVS